MLERIALTFVSGLTCRRIRQLLEIVNTPEELYRCSRSQLSEIFGKHTSIIDAIINKTTFARAEEELRFMEKHHIRPLFYTDNDYPQRLNQPDCEDTPPLLYYLGNADLNSQRVVSIVGTRKATEYGKSLTQKLVEGLKGEGVLVVSGLAYGIDTAAHINAVSSNIPTVGVVAHGLDQLYPTQNRKLATEMARNGGGILTEYPSQTRIQTSYFPARNRIIAALADAVVVVEASETGGALITANLANGYNREVMAFPGRVGDIYSAGTNRIIHTNKASLIASANDLIELMNWERRSAPQSAIQTTLPLNMTADQTRIHRLLSDNESLPIEEIMHQLDLSMPKIATALLDMELKGICKCLPGKRYRLL